MKKRVKQIVGSLALMGACLSYAMVSNTLPEAPALPGTVAWQVLAGN